MYLALKSTLLNDRFSWLATFNPLIPIVRIIKENTFFIRIYYSPSETKIFWVCKQLFANSNPLFWLVLYSVRGGVYFQTQLKRQTPSTGLWLLFYLLAQNFKTTKCSFYKQNNLFIKISKFFLRLLKLIFMNFNYKTINIL